MSLKPREIWLFDAWSKTRGRTRSVIRGLSYAGGGMLAGWLLPMVIGPYAFIGCALAVGLYLAFIQLRIERVMERHLKELQRSLKELVDAEPQPPSIILCGEPQPDEERPWRCTLPKGHTGDHIATIGPYFDGGSTLARWPATEPRHMH